MKNNRLEKIFKNKIILVTGGTGSIGSEIVRQLLNFHPKQVRVYSRDESKHYFLQQELEAEEKKENIRYLIGDIRDKDRLDKAMLNVNYVFHAAALKHVPFCEYNPFEAVKTNVDGAQNLIDLAIKHNIEKVVAISTDKAVYPNTIMGITKLLMERMIINAHNYLGDAKTKFAVVRFGNVLNSRGSVIPTWIEQIKQGRSVTVTDKRMNRFFISIPEAVNLVFYATSIMLGLEIMVLKMKEINIYKLAKNVIDKNSNGKKVAIKIIGSRDREKLVERLFTDEEEKYMIEKNKIRIILPNRKIYIERKGKY
ncbi:MAG: SDR family NAD(P)-dependent oxidoreductase [Bacteroidota bacterium]